jgi:sulfite reductase (NADPH) flavoprotein alpha-component
MFPEHAPFDSQQRNLLDSLLATLDPNQRAWLSGYLAAAAQPAPARAAKLTVLYGTESGNAESLAARCVQAARGRGYKPTLLNMAETTPAALADAENLLVIVSTWGDGEPPESATAFHKALLSAEAPSFASLRFSVCALGDTSYEKFCQTGKEIDARLEQLGATRLSPRQDCDVDYEAPFQQWIEAALTALGPAQSNGISLAAPAAASAAAPAYGKKNPFPAPLLERVLLNGKGSAKETWHFELSLEGSGLTYEPGDALAVLPTNAPDTVETLLRAARLSGSESVETKENGSKALAEALRHDLDITALSRAVLEKLAAASEKPRLRTLLAEENRAELKSYLAGRQVADAVADFFPEGLPAATLATCLRKLPPRLYSIASSPLAHPDQVHLTVAAVRYESHGLPRKGVCSTYLADLVATGTSVPVFVQPNKNFRLPSEDCTPVIMIGPGTGIAPFRAFVEHRAARGATGRNWLFFGDQHYLYDFLYQLEWQEHLKSGALHRLDLAFSRDQPEKHYVQHRLQHHAADLYAWLEEGAHLYVCGDASRMAHDVHETLLAIVQDQASTSRENAEAYLETLKKSHRYQRDVY